MDFVKECIVNIDDVIKDVSLMYIDVVTDMIDIAEEEGISTEPFKFDLSEVERLKRVTLLVDFFGSTKKKISIGKVFNDGGTFVIELGHLFKKYHKEVLNIDDLELHTNGDISDGGVSDNLYDLAIRYYDLAQKPNHCLDQARVDILLGVTDLILFEYAYLELETCIENVIAESKEEKFCDDYNARYALKKNKAVFY